MHKLLLLLFCGFVLASPTQAQQLQIGTLLVCETPEQIKRFVELGGNGPAITAVNAEVHDVDACVEVRVGFISLGEIGRVAAPSGVLRIIKVSIQSMDDGEELRMLYRPVTWYTLSYEGIPL